MYTHTHTHTYTVVCYIYNCVCVCIKLCVCVYIYVTSQVAQTAMQETWVQFLGSGRSPGGGKGNHSSIVAWRILWTEKPGGLQSIELQRVAHHHVCIHTHTYTHIYMKSESVSCSVMSDSLSCLPNLETESTSVALQGEFFTDWAIRGAPCVCVYIYTNI